MATPASTVRSRRALLAGLGGALAAVAAQAASRPLPALAEGEVMHVGGNYLTATTATQLKNSANNRDVFIANSTNFGTGVWGKSFRGKGVLGQSTHNAGVVGKTASATLGLHGPPAGVEGYANVTEPGHFGTAVRGENLKTGAYGGLGDGGMGVSGYSGSDSGIGVYGMGNPAVYGESNPKTGTALYAEGYQGYGLEVQGRAKFPKVSGVAIIAANAASITVNPGVPVGGNAFVLVTPQANIGQRTLWCTTSPAADTFTIHISTPRTSQTRIGYLMLG